MSNTQKKNAPKLRFPEFEGEWEEKELGEFCEFNNGINAKKEQYGIGRKFINVLDILNNNFITYENIIGKVSVPENVEKNNKVEFGDLVFLRSSETREDVGLCNVYLDKSYALYGGFIIRGKKVSDYNPIFLKEALNIPKKRYEIGSAAGGSTRFNVSQDILRKINVKFPTIEEQQKIGEFFSKLDRQIELEEQKLELLQQQKKAYMQKIFSQELRFKDENGNDYPDWEEKLLGEVAEIIGGGTPSTKNKLYWNGEINWFSPIEIGNKTYVYSSQKKITEEGLRKSSAKILPVGTILFTSRAGIGKTAILAKESTTNQGFQSIVPRKGVLDSYYVYTISNILKILAEKVGAGSTFSEISKKQMEQLNLNIPMIKEQKNISKFFSKFDNLIEIQERKLEFLKQRKQSLLQKTFV
ncbi:restriction endonuclease subunit S [Staphylococcus argenteus]|uniref:restriction endonuclease subunit S n=1 Tax=Staphylococcus argenteus TaxID=985002 RepID=UPI001EDC1BB3|nr:restriction endonuclease subunit S [Staphylococcus argenteus]